MVQLGDRNVKVKVFRWVKPNGHLDLVDVIKELLTKIKIDSPTMSDNLLR